MDHLHYVFGSYRNLCWLHDSNDNKRFHYVGGRQPLLAFEAAMVRNHNRLRNNLLGFVFSNPLSVMNQLAEIKSRMPATL